VIATCPSELTRSRVCAIGAVTLSIT